MKNFIEISYFQIPKSNQNVCGDTFLSMFIEAENRHIAVLSDGLGSGIKASVLSTLTSTIVCSCAAKDLSIKDISKMLMDVLPICSSRKIGYATFTIFDIDSVGNVYAAEYDNPEFFLFKNNEIQKVNKNIETFLAISGSLNA